MLVFLLLLRFKNVFFDFFYLAVSQTFVVFDHFLIIHLARHAMERAFKAKSRLGTSLSAEQVVPPLFSATYFIED